VKARVFPGSKQNPILTYTNSVMIIVSMQLL